MTLLTLHQIIDKWLETESKELKQENARLREALKALVEADDEFDAHHRILEDCICCRCYERRKVLVEAKEVLEDGGDE